jgi:membrane protease YdiL (CAAX protease family)
MNKRKIIWPVVATIAGLLLSPVLEKATKSEIMYNLALTALVIVFWIIFRFSRAAMGIKWGHWRIYIISLLYPIIIMGIIVVIVGVAGEMSLESDSWGKPLLKGLLMFAATIIGALITEDGFFRGSLWAVLRNADIGRGWTLLWTSAAFGLWHLPVAIFEPEFALQATVIPVYIINAFLIGIAWGALRMWSGSIVVPSVCHGIWNAMTYTLFGYGQKAGLLGVTRYWLYGPERGLLGLALNTVVAVVLVRWAFRQLKKRDLDMV